VIFRTDLAMEVRESIPEEIDGVISSESQIGGVKITKIKITCESGAQKLEKPLGDYITVEVPSFTDNISELDERLEVIKTEIESLIPEKGEILVCGLGNDDITPDSIGPKVAEKILATRHISGELAKTIGLSGLRSVCVISPGVLGQTGIETGEIILSLVQKIKPAAVIVIDALASRKLSRLGCTVQICNSGISPGSGVQNKRLEISNKTLGIPVIAIGVPTVVDGATLAVDLVQESGSSGDIDALHKAVEPRGSQMMVTPKEIDLLVERAAKLLSLAINCAIQPTLSTEDILELVSA